MAELQSSVASRGCTSAAMVLEAVAGPLAVRGAVLLLGADVAQSWVRFAVL